MKRLGFYGVALTAAISLAACGQPEDTTRTGTVADPAVGTAERTTTDDRETQEFVQRAVEKNVTEVELGRMAQERASDPQVRKFAQQMVEDHTKSLEELRQIAQRRNIQVNEEITDDGRRLQERLQGMKGPEFDREYLSAMVDAHREMQDLVEDRADRAPAYGPADSPAGRQPVGTVGEQPAHMAGQELDQWAAKTRPVVERHQQQAQELHQRLEEAGAGRR
jgi:putative membrane protein